MCISIIQYWNGIIQIDLYNAPKNKEEKERFDIFLQYTRNQLLELLDNYSDIKGFWFDGTWDKSWIAAYEFTYNLEKELREKHPD